MAKAGHPDMDKVRKFLRRDTSAAGIEAANHVIGYKACLDEAIKIAGNVVESLIKAARTQPTR